MRVLSTNMNTEHLPRTREGGGSFRDSQEYFDANQSPDSSQHNIGHLHSDGQQRTSEDGTLNGVGFLKPHICLLVLGPSGSGKSTFIAATSGGDEDGNMIGHGLDSYTTTCARYDFEDNTTSFTLLDTPGFNDTNRDDREILASIADFLLSNDTPPVSGVVFTHNITEKRFTGSARLNLDIVRGLCGPRFYPRVVLLTTMWNKVPSDVVFAECENREAQLVNSAAHLGDLKAGGCKTVRFMGTRESGLKLLESLRGLADDSPPSTQLVCELMEGKRIVDTNAGAVLMKERQRRERQRELELKEIREEQEAELRREQSRQAGLVRQQQYGRYDSDCGEMVHPPRVVKMPYKADDHMAYGENEGRAASNFWAC